MNIEDFIAKDRALLENTELGAKLGNFVGYGSYGFVLEYNGGSADKKVIKIFDSDYLAQLYKGEELEGTTVLLRCAQKEIETTRSTASTKSPYLMEFLNSPKPMVIGGKRLSFMVMPYLRTIAELDIGQDREGQIVEILCDCCSGLQVLHKPPEIVSARENGIPALVHYDIKPDNIFVSPGEPHHFLLGDYSIAQRIIDLKEDPKETPISANPYMAPGLCGPSSDIYSLGWVLYWWMKGQQHPTKEEVDARKENTLEMPESWGDNEELWNVFLRMTEKNPADRYPSAEETKKALEDALDARKARLEEGRATQRFQKGKDEGRVEGKRDAYVLVAALYIAEQVVKKVSASSTSISDGQGRLNGKISSAQPYAGGYFQGIWENGCPKSGTFSANGRKRKGEWYACSDNTGPFLHEAQKSVSGLCYEDNGQYVLYQGHVEVKWSWGASISYDRQAGSMGNGSIVFADGSKKEGMLDSLYDPNFLTGIFLKNEDGTYTGCGQFTVGPVVVECEITDNRPGPGVIHLPEGKKVCHTDANYERVMALLLAMQNGRKYFRGTWTEEGLPLEGTLISSAGDARTGVWEFGEFRDPFSKTAEMHFTGFRFVGDTGILFCKGNLTIEWSFGTRFSCELEGKKMTNSVMIFSDGKTEKGNFQCYTEENGCVGVQRREKNGRYTGCAELAVGPDAVMECEWRENEPGVGAIFLPDGIKVEHICDSYESVKSLLVTMSKNGGFFRGKWYKEGFPQEGTYTFGNGGKITSSFSYAIEAPYGKKALYSGMLGRDGEPCGAGSLLYSNGRKIEGEFRNGKYLK